MRLGSIKRLIALIPKPPSSKPLSLKASQLYSEWMDRRSEFSCTTLHSNGLCWKWKSLRFGMFVIQLSEAAIWLELSCEFLLLADQFEWAPRLTRRSSYSAADRVQLVMRTFLSVALAWAAWVFFQELLWMLKLLKLPIQMFCANSRYSAVLRRACSQGDRSQRYERGLKIFEVLKSIGEWYMFRTEWYDIGVCISIISEHSWEKHENTAVNLPLWGQPFSDTACLRF